VQPAVVRLEELDESHTDGLFAALDHELVGQFIGGPDVTTPDELRARISQRRSGPPPEREETWLNFAVLVDGVVVGRVEATLHDGIAEIAYVLGPPFWGHGYATAATADLITRLQRPQVGTVWACVHPANDRSTRVLSRLGFRQQPTSSGARLLSYDSGDLVFSLPLS
jgi:RimJ/RimL family protein N-acetyltransferase